MTETTGSYVCGISDAPLLGDTIGSALDRAVARWGDREALVSPSHDVRWTWRDFAARVDAVAAGFLALGLEPGARIGVWSLNRPEWTLTQFAAARAGLILVTINPAYRLSELEFALGKVGCAAIVEPSVSNMGYISTVLTPAQRAKAGPKNGAIASATVSIDLLGGINVGIASAPAGQGHMTVCAQVVADVFGLKPEQIAVNVEFDTAKDALSFALGQPADAVSPAGARIRYGTGEYRLRIPLRPRRLKDYLVYEEHKKKSMARKGLEMPDLWYRMPTYTNRNVCGLAVPDEEMAWPAYSKKLDFEFELAVVIGARAATSRRPTR